MEFDWNGNKIEIRARNASLLFMGERVTVHVNGFLAAEDVRCRYGVLFGQLDMYTVDGAFLDKSGQWRSLTLRTVAPPSWTG